MNLFFRLIALLLKRIFVFRRVDAFDPCATAFIVNPFDLDTNFHMNNGRYLSIMDLGRIDLLLRSGVLGKLLKAGYYPVVASESIRFKKSLELFQAFKIVTEIESWDEKDFFLLQTFRHKGDVVAQGYIKGRFKQRGRKGSVPTEEIFALLGRTFEGAQLSDRARAQAAVESHLAL